MIERRVERVCAASRLDWRDMLSSRFVAEAPFMSEGVIRVGSYSRRGPLEFGARRGDGWRRLDQSAIDTGDQSQAGVRARPHKGKGK